MKVVNIYLREKNLKKNQCILYMITIIYIYMLTLINEILKFYKITRYFKNNGYF